MGGICGLGFDNLWVVILERICGGLVEVRLLVLRMIVIVF